MENPLNMRIQMDCSKKKDFILRALISAFFLSFILFPWAATLASTTEATPEIKELARGLKHDLDLIYKYVHDHIEYTPIYGSLKEANGTLVDGRGNDFDQSSLMIALLREAGYTANLVYGVIRLDPEQITNWLGTNNDPYVVAKLLAYAGIDVSVYTSDGTFDGDLLYVDLLHVWVKVNIDGNDYVFDPSFKTYSYKSPVELPTAMGYNRNTFLTGALDGTTITSNYVRGVNRVNIRNSLAGYATNLIDYIKSNHPSANTEDIIGGRNIDPAEEVPRQASLPYQQPTTAEWTEIPDHHKTTLRIEHLGIDETLFTNDIYGKRLTIFYNASNQPVLRLDGIVIATGTSATSDRHALTLSVDHPYSGLDGTYADESTTRDIKAGGSYFILNGWTETGRRMIERHRKTLKENIHAGGDDTSEPVLGETLAMIGYTWLAEESLADEVADQIVDTCTIHHHWLGVCGQTDSPYIDILTRFTRVISKKGDNEQESASRYSIAGHLSAFEWGVFEQMQPFSAVSTVKLIDMANNQSTRIFDATSANYASYVKPRLDNYNSNELALVESFINNGHRVILPEDGNLSENQWTGIGFIAISSSEYDIQHMIGGELSGGRGNTNEHANADFGSDGMYQGNQSGENQIICSLPVDAVIGNQLYEHNDLIVGSSPYPIGLEFKRTYNSGMRLDDGPLGLGWAHNFHTAARVDSDGFQGMGEDSPVDAAAAVVEQYVANDILYGNKNIERVVIATLAHRWFMDQLIDNMVSVSEPDYTKRFLRLPDGSYNPPPGLADILTEKVDNSYLLRTKYGMELDFDAEGKLTAWKDPNDNTVTFTYNNGRLQTVNNGLNRTLSLTYDGERISQLSDGTGRNISYAYDAVGNLTGFTDSNGNTTTFEYDIDGRLTKIFCPAHPTIPFVSITYDSLGRVATQTGAMGNTSQYYLTGFRAEKVDPLDNSMVWRFNDRGRTILKICPVGCETTSAYDGHNRLIKKTYAEGNSEEYEYDQEHNITKVTLNPKPGSTESPITKLYTYEPTFNRLATFTDPLGRTTTLTYDGNGNLTTIDRPEVGGQIPKVQFTHNSRGQEETIIDPEGMTTGFAYDAATGDLLSITVDQGGLNFLSQFSYDPVGNLTQMTDPLGHTTAFQYDPVRRLSQKIAPSPLNYVTKYAYDSDGNLIRVENETGDGLNPWQTTTISYTPTGNMEIVTNPEGHVTTHQYDQADRLWKVTDAENQSTQYLYDPLGRIHQVIDAMGNISEEHTYTPNGQEASLKDASGNETQYEYDGFDRPDKTIYPDGSYEAFAHDSAGNLIQKRTRSGSLISYGYDNLNRIVSKTLPGPISVQYIYDLAGRMKDVTDQNGTIHHDFDTAGRQIGVTYPDGKTVGYAYDPAGNRTRLTYPDGYYVTYSYDALNRLTGVFEEGTTPLAQYDYDPLSRRTSLTYANTTSASYSYQIDNDLNALSHQFSGSSASFAYTHNNIGNRTGQIVNDDRYLFKLPTSMDVGYVSNSLNQYTSVDGVSFSYDGNGNLSSDGVNTYIYDSENRLIAATTTSHSVNYTYDPFGRRAAKTLGGVTTKYLHDRDHVIMEYTGSGQMLRRYVYGPGIDEPICMKIASTAYYYHFDALGSVIALTGSNGQRVESYAYSPYGKVSEPSSVGNPYLYTGREYDDETGLYYYRARYYHPQLGRFLQADPIRYNDETNLYSYVRNNPIGSIDPYGYASLPSGFKIGLSGFAAGYFGIEAGVELVYIRGQGWFTYKHVGAGYGAGIGVGVEVGFIWDLKEPDEYTGRFDEKQLSVIYGGSYFEAPDGPYGFSVGYGPGVGGGFFREHYLYMDEDWPDNLFEELFEEDECP